MKRRFDPVSPAEMRALQLGLLAAFDRHCRESGLRYYLWAGTLLGAMRHGGYIPWDDDIDVAMPRADYERLRREFAGSALARNFRLYHFSTDPAYDQPTIKLADMRALVLGDRPIPLGINLDIFPLDDWPSGRIGSRAARFALQVLFRLRWLTYARSIRPESARWKKILVALQTAARGRSSTRVVNRWIDCFLRQLQGSQVTVGIYHLGPAAKLARAAYGEPSVAGFEGRNFPVPADPPAVLTHLYGDWRRPPPPTYRHSHAYKDVVWVDPQTVAALDRLAPSTRATVRDVATLQAVLGAAGPARFAAPAASPPAAALLSDSDRRSP
jgi:lipopolysaccharide cholinephosphotransferase